jgi:hypothetical protein
MSRKNAAKKAPAQPKNPTQRPPYLQVSILCLVAAAVYLNTLSNGFVFDDNTQILQNPWVRDVRYLPTIFPTNVWAFSGSISN